MSDKSSYTYSTTCFCGALVCTTIESEQSAMHNIVAVCDKCGAIVEVCKVDDFKMEIEGNKYISK